MKTLVWIPGEGALLLDSESLGLALSLQFVPVPFSSVIPAQTCSNPPFLQNLYTVIVSTIPVTNLPPSSPLHPIARVIFLKIAYLMILFSSVKLSYVFSHHTHTHTRTHPQSLKGPFSLLIAFIRSFS